MKSRSNWQDEVDNAGAEACEASSQYAKAGENLQQARAEEAKAQSQVESATQAVAAASAGKVLHFWYNFMCKASNIII